MTLEELHKWHKDKFALFRNLAFSAANSHDAPCRKSEIRKLHKVADFHQHAIWKLNVSSGKGMNMNLTQLRIWHWKRVESHRNSQRRYEHKMENGDSAVFYNQRKIADHKREADFHLKCVQALNDVLETTVHQDLQKRKQAA
jgi:broad specificity polyphosphatase/5'/3'-nucleotidase SurE